MSTEENPLNGAVKNLSNGLSEIFDPLTDVQKQLQELTTKQNALISHIHNENLILAEVQHSPEILEMFRMVNTYHGKLINIRKDMKYLHDKGVKLKKRAIKLQEIKEKETANKPQYDILKREQDLIGGTSRSKISQS